MGKIRSQLRIVGSLMKESAMFSLSQLKADKFRTFLSLLGIVIGIFSIVAVRRRVGDAQEHQVRILVVRQRRHVRHAVPDPA